MMAPPLLTHVIVAYNHARFIEQAIMSAVHQTVPTRLVIVDDASADGTQQVVQDTLEREGCDAVFVRHTRNRGLNASLNHGLRHVETEYYAYFAGDDWIEPERAEVQGTAMKAAGDRCVLSYGDCYRAAEGGDRFDLRFSERHSPAWRTLEGDIFAALLAGDNWLPAPTLMQRADAVRSIGGYDETLAFEDLDMCLRLARVGDVAFVGAPLATHREHSASLGSSLFRHGNPRWLRDLVEIDVKHLGALASTDRLVAERVRDRVLRLYMSGEDAAWVDDRLRLTQQYVSDVESPTFRAYRFLARAGVPGRAVRRVRSSVKRASGVRRQASRSSEENPPVGPERIQPLPPASAGGTRKTDGYRVAREHPKLSVIMPCFDTRPERIGKAVDSYEAAALTWAELIIVDDGSTDPHAIATLEELAARGHRVVRAANGGTAAARNRGIAVARGDYVLPLDSDDRLDVRFCPAAVDVLDMEPEVEIVAGAAGMSGSKTERRRTPAVIGLADFLIVNQIPSSSMFRRSTWERLGGYDESLRAASEDHEWWTRILACGGRAVGLPFLSL